LASTLIEEQELSKPQLTPMTMLDKEMEEKTRVAIEAVATLEAKKKPTLASTSIKEQEQDISSRMPKTNLDKEMAQVAIEEQADVEEKKRPTLASTSIEEQPLEEAPQASLVTQDLDSTNKKNKQEQDPPTAEECHASVSNLITQQMLVSVYDPNANQNQKAALTYSNVGTSKDERKAVDPVSEETKLEVKLFKVALIHRFPLEID
jgi:hypothetical protein